MTAICNGARDWLVGALAVMVTTGCFTGTGVGQDVPFQDVGRLSDPQQSANGPLVIPGLPGTSTDRLVTAFNYISPFASILARTTSTSSAQPSGNDQLGRYYRSGGRSNLLKLPEMFGDFRSVGPGLTVTSGGESVATEIPLAAGIGGLRIAEDNQALPANRIWFGYNHFHNAFDAQPFPPLTPTQNQSLNRFVAATEVLLDEGRTSIELRMTFGSAINLTGVTATSPFRVDSDGVGNLSIILKRLLYGDACTAWSAGVGVETPTGSDATVQLASQQYRLENEAVHLVPFMAYTERYGRLFTHAFAQIDVATYGNEILAGPIGGAVASLGRINPQALLGVDVGLGYWLVQPNCARSPSLAVVSELHYTGGLGDEDAFAVVDGIGATVGANTPRGTTADLLNATAGLEFSTGSGWAWRTAVAAPLRDERAFDAEIIFQLNRTF